MHTLLTTSGRQFLINSKPIYQELDGCAPQYHGMLMNARMIQGVFDDKADPRRFDRFGRVFDPQQNTDDLISALPDWYAHGLRAITVGFQGGGPCYTIDSSTIQNSPYSADGTQLDTAYAARMERLILAADKLGMVVICSFFYGLQSRLLADDASVIRAVKTASNWLRENSFTNVIIEIANEHDITPYSCHPILYDEAGIAQLIEIARRESGGMLTGCSGTGGYFSEVIAKASDVILLHGNDVSRHKVYEMIQKAKAVTPERPLLINEDSAALSNMQVAIDEGVSWGYYNNMTKQEPPADWSITEGEDKYFALRMAAMLGIAGSDMPLEDQFYLQGLEPDATCDGKRWIRLASLHPEQIVRVDFYRNGAKVGTSYDDPFMLTPYMLRYNASNWLQMPFPDTIQTGEQWEATVHLVDGNTVRKAIKVKAPL